MICLSTEEADRIFTTLRTIFGEMELSEMVKKAICAYNKLHFSPALNGKYDPEMDAAADAAMREMYKSWINKGKKRKSDGILKTHRR